MQGMSSTLATSLAARLPIITSERYSQSIASIQSDASLVALFAPILTRLCFAEVESQTSAWDTTPLIDAWSLLIPEFERWQHGEHVPGSKWCPLTLAESQYYANMKPMHCNSLSPFECRAPFNGHHLL